MKFVRILRDDIPVWGVLDGKQVRILSEAPFQNITYDGNTVLLEDCKLLAPCEPTKIVCVGKNYFDHVKEFGGPVPEKPILFIKALNTLNDPEGEVHAPDFVERLDYEGELALVIKKRAKNVKAEEFEDYILGYTCLNDVTARDIQYGDGQWTRGKGMDGFCPIGPLVTDEIDGSCVDIETRLNGEVRQKANTELFMTKLPEMMEFITAAMTLEPGDVVATGTPAGIGPMKPGDMVEVEIQDIGVLRNYIV